MPRIMNKEATHTWWFRVNNTEAYMNSHRRYCMNAHPPKIGDLIRASTVIDEYGGELGVITNVRSYGISSSWVAQFTLISGEQCECSISRVHVVNR